MQSITLTSGIRVAVEISKLVVVTASGSSHEATRVELPYPRHGVGGSRLIAGSGAAALAIFDRWMQAGSVPTGCP